VNHQQAGESKAPPDKALAAFERMLLTVVGLLSLSYPVEELSRRAGDMYFRLRREQGTSPMSALILIG